MALDLSSLSNFNPFVIVIIIAGFLILRAFLEKNKQEEEEEKTPYEIISDVIRLDYKEQLNVLGITVQEAGYSIGNLWYHTYKLGYITQLLEFKFKYFKPVTRTVKKKIAGTEIEEKVTEEKPFDVEYILLEVYRQVEDANQGSKSLLTKILDVLTLGVFSNNKVKTRSEIFLLRKDLVLVNVDYNTNELNIIIPDNYHIIKYNGVWVIDDAVNRLHPEAVSDRIKFNEISAQLTLLPVKMAFLQEGVAVALAQYEKQKEMMEFQKQLREEGIKKEV